MPATVPAALHPAPLCVRAAPVPRVAGPLPLRCSATYPGEVLPLANSSARRRDAVRRQQREVLVLLGVGLLLGVVGGWLAGLVRVRTP